ncbi:hypothetical protein AB4Z51_43935 [Bradyrhizobium sp. 2TAF36]|uniref:hypothetical protein n=1 Tax=Bradyrhizobium sp. 2TAF36 TaxID=3233016 RepID=UPI003F8FEF89
MEEITSEDEIAELEPEKVIVSVFILSGYDRSAINWLKDTWEQIHEDTGSNWVLVAPVKTREVGSAREIDIRLSDRIRKMYGIAPAKTPCLVFDNFIDEEHQNVLSLTGDDGLLKSMMLSMKRRIDEELEALGDIPRTDRWRQDVTRKLFDAGKWTRDERALLMATKKAFSVVPTAAKFLVGKYF